MVVLKRKPGEKENTYSYSTVEIQSPKSFNDAQNSITIDENTEIFSKIKQNKDYEIHPEIKKEVKEQPAKKEAVSSKTKVILMAYLAVAIILAAIVIATGMAVSNAQSRVSRLQTQRVFAESTVKSQEDELTRLSDPDTLRGIAVGPEYNMVFIDENEVIKIPKIELSDPVVYEKSTNWFDDICRFFSRIFT